MNEVLKQRLVGALILLALGVIFWPIIFVQPEREEQSQQHGIPPNPGVVTEVLTPPELDGLRASPDIAAHAEAQREYLPAPPPEEAAPVPSQAQEDEAVVAAPEPRADSKPESPARSPKPEPLKLDADGVPVAWILQVASVSSADKAESLRQELIGLHHEAYVEKVRSNGKTLYRVYIGPKFEQAELEAKRAAIDARFGVQTLIRRYVP